MNAVIPSPTGQAAQGAGSLAAAGPWHVRADRSLGEVADTVRSLLAPHLGARLLPDGDPREHSSEIVLTLDTTGVPLARTVGVAPSGTAEPADEAYALTIGADGITCRARTPEGVFRAATSAAQLLLTTPPDGAIEALQLRDAPHYAWRGLMIDPARSFVTPDEVRRVIDLAALYKLNVLHLHLTDNEGWRLAVPSLPALTAGADASGPDVSDPDASDSDVSAPGVSDPDASTAPAFYSADEYRALQAYAARRFVTIVPEIDLPGHCATLRAALPDLPPAPAPEGLADRFPFVPPLDLADAATHSAVSAVLADVCALTDGPFVHIGCDEAVGITADAFKVAVRELRGITRKFGKRPVAWQEASRAGSGPEDIAQFWVDVPMMDLPASAEEFAARPELAASGMTMEIASALRTFFAPSDHDVERVLADGGRLLLSPQSHLYLDRRYSAEVTPPGQTEAAARLGFPHYLPRDVRHTASWDPASHGIPDESVAGVEATLFGETLRGIDDLTTLLLPRLGSVAETAWSGRPPLWAEYRGRIARHAPFWRERGLVHFAAEDVPWA
ncbi:family 20 glycosylhydrolase [Streptomyces sp. NBC_00401]|uniref:family 20 glycosylhydrolase n=1 Tax=Streptomyces sp. NBC_00401 TaxID=2975738 RepID=UPI0022500B10|nr:family 20 glycosylhydrolase [Streptomyces sp. NBC_00401]MCX5086294.1 beta-N-acetylhexosaminidase [Streptomyces sp. NBC_00401]